MELIKTVRRVGLHRRHKNQLKVARASVGVAESLEARTLLAATPVLLHDPGWAGLFVEAGGKAFFSERATTLFVSNGTAGGTFALGSDFGSITDLTAVGNDIYLTASTGVWRSDGTLAGTTPIFLSSNNIDGVTRTRGFAQVGGSVYFAAGSSNYGLYRTGGTAQSTTLLADIFADALTPVGNTLFFAGEDDEHGRELWKSDGTRAGTQIVKDIFPGQSGLSNVSGPDAIAEINGRAVLSAVDGSSPFADLWSSDGSEAGTFKIASQVSGRFSRLGSYLYFMSGTTASNVGLWRTDGTAAGTVEVKRLGASTSSQLLNVGDLLYFTSRDGPRSVSLWKTDGTSVGTQRIAGQAEGQHFEDIYNLTDVSGSLAFTATDFSGPTGIYSLWLSDGTTSGTNKVRNTFLDGMSGTYGHIGSVNTTLLFTANDGVGAPELYSLQIAAPPPLPLARTEGPAPFAVDEGGTVVLHGYASSEPLPGRPLTYEWDLDNDGVFGETGDAAIRGGETGADPTFNALGLDGPSTYTVRLRISDPTGYSDTADAEVNIRNVAPSLDISGAAVITQGTPFTLNLAASDPGPDTISQWIIDWGDGVPQTVAGASTVVSHQYPLTPRGYEITATAVDEDGRYSADRPTSFDPTFNGSGRVGVSVTTPVQMTVQTDGKVLALGSIQRGSLFNNTVIAVTRFNQDGSVDLTFGASGYFTFDASAYGEAASSMVVQPDGRIVVVGSIRSSIFPYEIGPSLVLMRLLPDGSLDPTFGGAPAGGVDSRPGWVTYDLGPFEWIDRLEITSAGQIVGGGTVNSLPIFVRFNADGSRDLTFDGKSGPPAQDPTGPIDRILDDGKRIRVSRNFYVQRFLPDGNLDPTFAAGSDGIWADPEGDGQNNFLVDAAVQADGSVLLFGEAGTPHSPGAALVRLSPTGHSLRVVDAARPQITVAAPSSTLEASTYTLGLGARDPDGDVLTPWIIDWGDGVVERFDPATTSAQHIYADGPLNTLLKASIIDSDGSITSAVRGVSILNVAPTITVTGGEPVAEGTPTVIGFRATDPGPDAIHRWLVDWGDGNIFEYLQGVSTASHIYADEGEYVVTVTGVDEDGTYAGAPLAVLVSNVDPILELPVGRVAAAGAAFSLSFSAVDAVAEIFAGSVNWGDGTGPLSFSDAAAGPAKSKPFSLDHVYASPGAYTVTVNVADGDGGAASSTVTVRVGDVIVRTYEDRRGNGVRDPGDPAMAGVLTYLDINRNGLLDAGEPTSVTDESGDALFADLPADSYAARVIAPSTYHLSDPAAGFVGVTPGTASAVGALGITQAAAVSGILFRDENANGLRDPGEAPLAVALVAEKVGGNDVIRAIANSNGLYSLRGLLPGQYLIRISGASGIVTAPFAQLGHLVTVTGAEAGFSGLDIGLYSGTGGFLRGFVYEDANANGRRDDGEPNIEDSTVFLDANDNGKFDANELSSPTINGVWAISRVPFGTHLIRQVIPSAGWRQTEPSGGNGAAIRVTVREGQRIEDLNFGSVRLPAAIVGRHLLYVTNPQAAGGVSGILAVDKSPLRPNAEGSFANISSFSRGINGVVIDITGLPQNLEPTAADFAFAMGNGGDPRLWTAAPPPISVTVQRKAGFYNSDRITLVWADGVIRNTWLQVTMRPSLRTNLLTDDVFYFGSLPGETGDNPAVAAVTASDLVRVRNAVGQPAATANKLDFDRNGVINAADLVVARNSVGKSLAWPTFAAPLDRPGATFSVSRILPLLTPQRDSDQDPLL